MKSYISYFIWLLCIPVVLILGATVFASKQYAWVSLAVAILACVPSFLRFEHQRQNTTRLVLLAVMTALSVLGRFLFAPVPGFKPVAAISIITGLYLGGEAGFLCGSLSAVVSNFYFGQGPWTPFQMFTWGMIGLIAGLLSRPLKANRWLLALYGALAGVGYSLLIDAFEVLWAENAFNLTRYLAMLATSAPFMALYAAANVVFLLLLTRPIGEKLERMRTKYGL